MPIRFIPFVSDTMTNAPMIDPVTLPTPPATDTPPTKAAAIASNSVKNIVRDDYCARTHSCKLQGSPVAQPPGKRCNKGWDIHLRHQESGKQPRQNSEHQYKRYGHINRQEPELQSDCRDRAEEARQKTDR